MEVSTGDKILGKVKEGLGKITGDKDLKEEGKAVHKTEKDLEKVEKQQEKVAKQSQEVYEHASKGGVSDPSNITVGEKLTGAIKQGVGALIGDKNMEKEGKAVGKAEEAYEKLEKNSDKLADKQGDLAKHSAQAKLN
ncbi:hypothetical protein AKO1_008896 [Acrasis kona]|uniref:CsbD-like domain-containing protein n=1 Tax=Acrasis kona TaxID=1008807 RepID=A0AAW2ZDA6_9EUKA